MSRFKIVQAPPWFSNYGVYISPEPTSVVLWWRERWIGIELEGTFGAKEIDGSRQEGYFVGAIYAFEALKVHVDDDYGHAFDWKILQETGEELFFPSHVCNAV